MKRCILISLFTALVALAPLADASAHVKIKTLIVTGQNNHNWQVSYRVLKDILENTFLFEVSVAISPAKGEDMSSFIIDFNQYDLVVVDYNGDYWPKETMRRFEAYAVRGGGIVIYHAANNAFPQWNTYNQICGLGGWEGRDEKAGPYAYMRDGKLIKDDSPGPGGSHGSQHRYVMHVQNRNHPITQGLPGNWLHAQDELYDRMRGPANINALLYTALSDSATGGSGREEPLIFTVKYGRARIFHTMLGHCGTSRGNNPAMQCAGFQITLLRGAEWAATGKVTQDLPTDFPPDNEPVYRPDYYKP
jgi:type 1 glutamine amidotransferase